MHLREDRRHIRDTDLERDRRPRRRSGSTSRWRRPRRWSASRCAASARLLPGAGAAAGGDHRGRPGRAPARRTRSAAASTRWPRRASGSRCSSTPIRASSRPPPGSARLSSSCTPAPTPRAASGETGASAAGRRAPARARAGVPCRARPDLRQRRPVAAIPEVEELNIGHFLIGQSVMDGLPGVVRRMKAHHARGPPG